MRKLVGKLLVALSSGLLINNDVAEPTRSGFLNCFEWVTQTQSVYAIAELELQESLNRKGAGIMLLPPPQVQYHRL